MKKLVAELMNHGFTEHQAHEFLLDCFTTFKAYILNRWISIMSEKTVLNEDEK